MSENIELYYTAPSGFAFEEMKKACLKVWEQYKGEPGGYYESKIERIQDLKNIRDNFMFMFAMFDYQNQRKVADLLSENTKQAVRERYLAGGGDEGYLILIGL